MKRSTKTQGSVCCGGDGNRMMYQKITIQATKARRRRRGRKIFFWALRECSSFETVCAHARAHASLAFPHTQARAHKHAVHE